MSRILIIVWRWKPHTINNIEILNENENFFELPVGNSGNKIIGFTSIRENNPYTIEQILNAIQRNQNNKVFILLHGSEQDPGNDVINKLKNKLEDNDYKVFSGSDSNYIYKILIDEKGRFGRNIVLEDAFNKVWEHYCKSCKKKLYELKEELLLNLYPVIFTLENGNEKIQLPDLKEKITNFIKEEERYKDCNYGKGVENIISDLKGKLKILLNKPADELLQVVKVKGLDDSKENKYLAIPEYLRAKFDELLISYNKDEPIY